MTLGAIAGLIAAIAFVALVALAAVPLLKLGRVLEEVRLAVRDIGLADPTALTTAVAAQRYLPEELTGAEYYRPTPHGAEAALADRLQRINELLGR